jgi:hypothetical protein
MDLSELLAALRSGNDAKMEERSICIALHHLKEKHLIYFHDEYKSIISVIDTDQIF